MRDNSFGILLNRIREDRGFLEKELGAGLCAESEVSKIERGERFPEKALRDRLLARLGESGYCYENFLQPNEYEDWERKAKLLILLEEEDNIWAEEWLERYYADAKDKVVRQFYLAMKLQLLEFGYGDYGKKGEYLTEAVFLTIPWEEKKRLSEQVLSIEELNLILEYVFFTKPANEEERYRELLAYLKAEYFDEESRAMLVSKVSYYYCTYLWDKLAVCTDETEHNYMIEQALSISDAGIESLRDNERLYFAWELLQKEAELLRLRLCREDLASEEREHLIRRQKWNEEFFGVLDELYEEFQVPRKTCAYTYFYHEYEIYCISDILRARRKMMGYGKRDFEEDGVCTYRSVCRIEAGKSSVQRGLAKHMMRKLNLSSELQRAQIITDSQQALRMEKECRNAMNQRNFDEAEHLLEELKKLIPMELLINRQYVECHQCDLDFYRKRIGKEEYMERLKQVLELTIPFDAAMQPIRDKRLSNGFIQKGEKYLTNVEIVVLKTLANLYGDNKENPYPFMLLEYYRQFEQQGSTEHMITMRGFVLAYIVSYLGNIGEYDASDEIGERLLRDELRLRRLERVDHLIYSRMWNDEQRKIKHLPVQPDRQSCLEKCIVLTDFCKNEMRNQWVRGKLQKFIEDGQS